MPRDTLSAEPGGAARTASPGKARPADYAGNPTGTDGLEFIEFTSPDPHVLAARFSLLGFTAIGRHRSKNVFRYRQGGINFLLNMEPSGQAADYRLRHGPSANAMAFRVRDSARALALALQRGAAQVRGPVGPAELNIPAIEGIGGCSLYLVDRYGADEIYDVDFVPIDGAAAESAENAVGLTTVERLDHTVLTGQSTHAASLYERLFNFKPIASATKPAALEIVSPCRKIFVKVTENADTLDHANDAQTGTAEGLWRLILGCDDLAHTTERLNARGIHPLRPPAPGTPFVVHAAGRLMFEIAQRGHSPKR